MLSSTLKVRERLISMVLCENNNEFMKKIHGSIIFCLGHEIFCDATKGKSLASYDWNWKVYTCKKFMICFFLNRLWNNELFLNCEMHKTI